MHKYRLHFDQSPICQHPQQWFKLKIKLPNIKANSKTCQRLYLTKNHCFYRKPLPMKSLQSTNKHGYVTTPHRIDNIKNPWFLLPPLQSIWPFTTCTRTAHWSKTFNIVVLMSICLNGADIIIKIAFSISCRLLMMRFRIVLIRSGRIQIAMKFHCMAGAWQAYLSCCIAHYINQTTLKI